MSNRLDLFVDTWGWLVLEDRADPHHQAVDEIRRNRRGKAGLLITTDFVLDEMITRLFARRPFAEAQRFMAGLLAAEKDGVVRIETITRKRFDEAYGLRIRYRDKPRISFTDLTSFVVMLERDIKQVLTGDDHFVQAGLGFQKLP